MSYKIKIELEVLVDSKGVADRITRDAMETITNQVAEIAGVVKATARHNRRDEFVLNLPDSEFEPGMLETTMTEGE